jgi:hypothetical protein
VLGGNDERMYVRKKGFFLISHCLSTTRYAVLVSLCFFLSILQLYWVVIKLVKSIERNWKSRKWRPLLHLLQYCCNYWLQTRATTKMPSACHVCCCSLFSEGLRVVFLPSCRHYFHEDCLNESQSSCSAPDRSKSTNMTQEKQHAAP